MTGTFAASNHSAGGLRQHFILRRRNEDRATSQDGRWTARCLRGGRYRSVQAVLHVSHGLYSGRHLSIREVEYFQSARIRMETEHPLDVYADGEYVCRTPVENRYRNRLR